MKSIPHDPLHDRKMRWPVWYSLCKFFALLWADKLPVCFVWHGLSLHYSVFTRSGHFLWMILYQKRNRLKTHFFSCCGKYMIFSCGNFTGCRSANATRNAVGKLSQYKSGGNTWFLRNQMIISKSLSLQAFPQDSSLNLLLIYCLRIEFWYAFELLRIEQTESEYQYWYCQYQLTHSTQRN